MGRARSLIAAVEASGAGAFLADTAPIIYRIERGARSALIQACDPLFDAVEAGALGCVVSAISVAELMIEPFRSGPAAVSFADAFLRQPMVGVVEIGAELAREAAVLLAAGRVNRLPDALIAASANALGLPLVTGDRRLARAGASKALLVADFG